MDPSEPHIPLLVYYIEIGNRSDQVQSRQLLQSLICSSHFLYICYPATGSTSSSWIYYLWFINLADLRTGWLCSLISLFIALGVSFPIYLSTYQLNRFYCKLHIIIQLSSFPFLIMKSYDWESQASSTQRLATLKRSYKQTYTAGLTQQDLINQIAKGRLLEDELFAQKMKNETLERKNIQYIETIAQLQYSLGDLKFMLQRAEVELKRHLDAEKDIEAYSSSLKQVGQQISNLNQILDKKNKECLKLVQNNNKLKQQNSLLQEGIRKNQIKKQSQLLKLKQILQLLNIQRGPMINQQLVTDMELIEQGIISMRSNIAQAKNALQKCRKQHSQALIKQKQNSIALQYKLKLAEKRNQDLQKKNNIQSSLVIDKRIQDIIEDMLKKQDELGHHIVELQSQNEKLKQLIQNQKVSNSYYVELKQNDYQKQLKNAKSTIKQLIHEKQSLKEKIQQLSNIKQIQSSRFINEQLEISKRYRESTQQNRRLKLKINELESDKKMLQKQLNIRTFN